MQENKSNKMMDAVKPPGSLKLTGNVNASKRFFKKQLLLYTTFVGVDRGAEERKIGMLVSVAGTGAIEVFNTFVFAQHDGKDEFNEVVKKFDERCFSKKNKTYKVRLSFMHTATG